MPIAFVKPLVIALFYALFALLSWRRLNWAVLLVIAALPSYLIRFHIGPIPATLLEWMLLIVIVAAIFHRIKKVRAEIVPTQNSKTLLLKTFNYPLRARLALPLGLFLLAATISVFVAPDLRAAAGAWKAYFIEPILFFVILLDLLIHHPNLLNRRQIITAFSVSALLLSLYAIYQRLTGFGIPPPWDTELRVTSIFPYPNALGLFLGPLVPLMLSATLNEKLKIKNVKFYILHFTFYIIAIIASVIAIVFAKSTGALVGVGAGIVVMSAFYVILSVAQRSRRIPRHSRITGFLAGLGMTVLVVVVIFALLRSPLRDELLLRDWSGHVRRTQWAETWQMLKDRPMLGAGLTSYQETLEPYHKATYLEIFEYPHNIVLNFWSETGLLGLITFMWLVVIFFRKTFLGVHNPLQLPLTLMGRDRSVPPLKVSLSAFGGRGRGSYELITLGAAAAMIILLVHGLVDVPYFKNDLAILFWIIYALGLASTALPDQSPS